MPRLYVHRSAFHAGSITVGSTVVREVSTGGAFLEGVAVAPSALDWDGGTETKAWKESPSALFFSKM